MPHGYMRHPPVRRVPWVTSKKRLEDTSWDVHDLGAHSEEDLGGLVLREEVRDHYFCWTMNYVNMLSFNSVLITSITNS